MQEKKDLIKENLTKNPKKSAIHSIRLTLVKVQQTYLVHCHKKPVLTNMTDPTPQPGRTAFKAGESSGPCFHRVSV